MDVVRNIGVGFGTGKLRDSRVTPAHHRLGSGGRRNRRGMAYPYSEKG